MHALVPAERGLDLARLTERAKGYVGQAKAKGTLKAYQADWRDFLSWCASSGECPLPASPEALALYLTDRAETLKVSTLQRRIAAISQAHQAAGCDPPHTDAAVRAVWAGIRRVKGVVPEEKAAAVTSDLRRMVETLNDNLLGVRDRALLLVGFAGAFRRSELVGLDRKDVEITSEGITVTVRRSKTDQEGRGRRVGIPYGSNPDTCPVRAMQAWLEASGIEAGPLFRSVNRHGQLQPGRLTDKVVALVVKRCADAAGLDPSRYSGHSLRAGLATSAAMNGASERAIMKQTGHRSTLMVRRYIRDASLFRENAAALAGL